MLVCKECAKLGKVLGKIDYRTPKRRSLSQRLEEAGRDLTEEELIVEDFGDRIKKARENMGLSREDLAKLVGIKVSLLAKIENNELLPEDRIRKKLEKVLKIKLTY